jgi:hypothetical protein
MKALSSIGEFVMILSLRPNRYQRAALLDKPAVAHETYASGVSDYDDRDGGGD